MTDAFEQLEPVLAADEIQGNILGGFNKDHQAVMALRFAADNDGLSRARTWLGVVLQGIAWLPQIIQYKRNRYKVIAATRHEPARNSDIWSNISFSYQGLRKLTAEADAFEPTFKAGLTGASGRLGDPTQAGQDGHMDGWVVGKPGQTPDILVIMACDRADVLDEAVADFRKSAADAGIDCLHCETGHNLSFYNTATSTFPGGHEHFGFKDGVSQPGIRGRMSPAADDFLTPRTPGVPNLGDTQPEFSAPGQPLVCVGEFVLGYKRQNGSFARRTSDPWKLGPEPFAMDPTAIAPYWAKNGSFLVYRRLRQDVVLFNRLLVAEAERLSMLQGFAGMTAQKLGSMLVGRWPSGAPFLRSPLAENSTLGGSDGPNNAFGYNSGADPQDGFPAPARDPLGALCPQAAHIRKVNPRDLPTDQGPANTTLVHRFLRRGIAYGPPLPIGSTDEASKTDRGLLFLSYQASIRDQFEFISGNWMNDRKKPSPFPPADGSGFDMIVGQNPKAGENRVRFCLVGPAQTSVAAPDQWVITTGGGYFFTPSRSAIQDVLVRGQSHC